MPKTQFLITPLRFSLLLLHDITAVLPGPDACKIGIVLTSTFFPELQALSLGRIFPFLLRGNKS